MSYKPEIDKGSCGVIYYIKGKEYWLPISLPAMELFEKQEQQIKELRRKHAKLSTIRNIRNKEIKELKLSKQHLIDEGLPLRRQIKELEDRLTLEENLHLKYRDRFHAKLEQITELEGKVKHLASRNAKLEKRYKTQADGNANKGRQIKELKEIIFESERYIEKLPRKLHEKIQALKK